MIKSFRRRRTTNFFLRLQIHRKKNYPYNMYENNIDSILFILRRYWAIFFLYNELTTKWLVCFEINPTIL